MWPHFSIKSKTEQKSRFDINSAICSGQTQGWSALSLAAGYVIGFGTSLVPLTTNSKDILHAGIHRTNFLPVRAQIHDPALQALEPQAHRGMERHGRIEFEPSRVCALHNDDGRLQLRVETATDEELERTQNTVVNHLKRFAFKEDLGDIVWTREG
jgi:hypothetical protein